MDNVYNYLLTPHKLTIVGNGRHVQIEKTHQQFEKIKQLLKERKFEEILEIVDTKTKIKKYMNNKVEIENGVVTYNGVNLHGKLIDRILQFQKEDFDYEPLIKFLENQLQNPVESAVDSLYDFIEHGNMPITQDGCFLAYKCVGYDFRDCYTGTFDNNVGQICKMNRMDCDFDRGNSCSSGLHVCTFDYIKSFYSIGNRVMIVKVNPKDVISVPYDYSNAKMRCCEYEVIEEYKDFDNNKAKKYFDDSGYYDIKIIENTTNDLPKLEIGEIYELTKYYNDSLRKGVKIKIKNMNNTNVWVTRPRGGVIHCISIDNFSKITKKC